jgi:hypothetical protein
MKDLLRVPGDVCALVQYDDCTGSYNQPSSDEECWSTVASELAYRYAEYGMEARPLVGWGKWTTAVHIILPDGSVEISYFVGDLEEVTNGETHLP